MDGNNHVEVATIAVLSKFSGVPCERITAETQLGQGDRTGFVDLVGAPLGLDSLDLVNVAMELEERFGIDLPDEDVDKPELGTVRGLVDHVQAKLKANDVAEEEGRPADRGARGRPAHGGYPDLPKRQIGPYDSELIVMLSPERTEAKLALHVGRIRRVIGGAWDGTYVDVYQGDTIIVTEDMEISSNPRTVERMRQAPASAGADAAERSGCGEP